MSPGQAEDLITPSGLELRVSCLEHELAERARRERQAQRDAYHYALGVFVGAAAAFFTWRYLR